MHILNGRHALYGPPVDASQRQGATLVGTMPEKKIQIFKMGVDPFREKDLKGLCRIISPLNLCPQYVRSAPHAMIRTAIANTLKNTVQCRPEIFYLAVNSDNQLQAIVKGTENKLIIVKKRPPMQSDKHLEQLASFQNGIATHLLALFYSINNPNIVSVHKGQDVKFKLHYTNNSWHTYPFSLSDFYRSIGFQKVDSTEMAFLSCPFSQIQAWCQRKLESVRFVHNAQPQALVLAGLGDGNTMPP